MNLMQSGQKSFMSSSGLLFLAISAVYCFLTFVCLDHCYFWDAVQQISCEAHWYYDHDFSSWLLPGPNDGEEITATGYHAPFMSLTTALLWKVFGYQLAVSHLYVLVFALVLIYATIRLTGILFPARYAGWIAVILLSEPTVLSQFAIASPDFILLSGTMLFLYGLFADRKVAQGIGFFFLCAVNMRGVFLGLILWSGCFLFAFLERRNNGERKILRNGIFPFLPTTLLLASYYSAYLYTKGWFFTNSAFAGHYEASGNIGFIVKHLLSLLLRIGESGRFLICLLALWFLYNVIRRRSYLKDTEKMLAFFVVSFTGMYLLFVAITQMPFSSRYFLPFFAMLTLLVSSLLLRHFAQKGIRIFIGGVLLLQLTGHFWIYPDRISQSWESTLMHLPYYELRDRSLHYIDSLQLDYRTLSAGFPLYGNRRFVDLSGDNRFVDSSFDSCRYYLTSNICNEPDVVLDALDSDAWRELKRFEKGVVRFSLYQRTTAD